MSEDIFAYRPITEWNNQIVQFGMPSTDGNTRLTEIVLAAESCLEASNNATQLSFTDNAFSLARTSPVQKIIRTLFGEETGIEIETFAAVSEEGVAYFMSPLVTAAALLLEKDWIYEIVTDNMNIGFHPTFFVEYTNPLLNIPVTNSTWHRRYVLNPLASGSVITGNRAISGNWDNDGEPYWEFTWEGISVGKCSDNVQTNQWSCENTNLGGYCRITDSTQGYCSNSAYNGMEVTCLSFGTCSNPAYNNNQSGCLSNFDPGTGEYYTWASSYTWKSMVGSPPIAFKKDDGTCSNPAYDGDESQCTSSLGVWTARGPVEANIAVWTFGQYICTYGSGQCWYSSNNLDTETWAAYGNPNTHDWCVNVAPNVYPYYYWTWIPPSCDWTNITGVWRPSSETLNEHLHYNIQTSENYKLPPFDHLPDQHAMQGSTVRKYLNDTGIAGTWGDGAEIGRSSTPTWITNTFTWENNDLTFDYCYDTGWNPQHQWSPPLYMNDEACLASGTCTGAHSPGSYHNDEAGCLAQPPYCSGGGWTNQTDCLNASYCTDGQWTSQTACLNEGTCWVHICFGGFGCVDFQLYQYANNPGGCNAQPNASFSYAGNSWNNYNYTWFPPNVFISDNYVWNTVVPDIEVDIPIEPTYFWNLIFPAHSFVDVGQGGNSSVTLLQGYTSGLGNTQPNYSKIRWAPPQYNQVDYNKQFPRPTKFRIYRSPAWYNNLTSDTDNTNNIFKLAGEVTCESDDGYHYFYDTREDMFTHGLREYQHAYYAVTAVWENWNYKRGYTVELYSSMSGPGTGASPQKWDIHYGQSWTATQNNVMYQGICSNSNYTDDGQSACENAGSCNGNSNYNDNMGGCLAEGICSDPTYNNNEAGCLGAFGTWTSANNWWSSYNYTWTIGQWNGSPNSSADLDNVENASPMGGYPQLMNAIRFTSSSNYRTYRASGYFRAPVTGTYYFQVRADDPVYLWLGTAGQTVDGPVGLTATRTWYNATAEVPGNHPPQYNHWPDSATSLTAGEWYPLLAYGGQHTGGFAFDIRILYPSGAWNNNSGSEWKYVPFEMMPEDMDPGMHGDGQTVEGNWTSQTVPAWYTGFP